MAAGDASLEAQGPSMLPGAVGRHDFRGYSDLRPLAEIEADLATRHGLTAESLEHIFCYCAEEVARQQDGAIYVWHLYQAWQVALRQARQIPPAGLTLAQIEGWGRLVSPQQNQTGYRKLVVRVGLNPVVDWRDVPGKLSTLIAAIGGHGPFEYQPTAVEMARVEPPLTQTVLWRAFLAYYNFERIHPFRDGNGRTGKILLNYVAGTLHAPLLPPNFFDCSNP